VSSHIADAQIGAPTSCVYYEPNGNLEQQTQNGMLYETHINSISPVTIFTDGTRHWALVGGQTVVEWDTSEVEPPASAVQLYPPVVPPPTADQIQQTRDRLASD
jgi:hypothetical protein